VLQLIIMPNTDSLLDPQDTFATLCTTVGLDIRLRKGLSRLGYVRPTLVQSKCLPLAITSGRDLLVRARTGSGKTLAYCLPILHKILSKEENDDGDGFVKAVILVPTRELCTQVTNTLTSLIYYCDEVVSVATLFSGKNSSETSLVQQEAMLRDRPDVLVSTPAGLLAHIKRDGSLLKTTLKESVDSLVVDEADLVLSFGK
jgi:ATP-dependent RNA helicase DDX56/DBP9